MKKYEEMTSTRTQKKCHPSGLIFTSLKITLNVGKLKLFWISRNIPNLSNGALTRALLDPGVVLVDFHRPKGKGL